MTLIVIDVQPGFAPGRFKSLIEECGREINRAKRSNSGIILLECDKHGRTVGELRRLLDDYPFYSIVTKTGEDGGIECIDNIFHQKYSNKNIRVCGIFADMCVKSTVQ